MEEFEELPNDFDLLQFICRDGNGSVGSNSPVSLTSSGDSEAMTDLDLDLDLSESDIMEVLSQERGVPVSDMTGEATSPLDMCQETIVWNARV